MVVIRGVVVAGLIAVLGACAGVSSSAGGGGSLPLVEAWFTALAAEDRSAAERLVSANAEVVLPFAPSGDTSDAAVRRIPVTVYLGAAFDRYDNLVFVQRRAHVANDGASVFVEARGDLRIAATGQPYRNRYLFRFDIYDGRIERIVEYSNPVTAARAARAR